jgi:RimJ/RimL family protein N-acetyltransferase
VFRMIGVKSAGDDALAPVEPERRTPRAVGRKRVRTWNDEQVFEIGWAVHPKVRDLGLRKAADQAIASARSEGLLRVLLACPSVDNERSNAVCRQTGFTLVEQHELEYELGSFVACNVWSLDLTSPIVPGTARP